jgi:hypothetical protein
MRPASNSANASPVISRNVAGRAVRDALCEFVGRGRDWTVKQLSNRSGVPDRRIECALCDPDREDFRPLGIEHLLSIALILGPDFTDLWLETAKQGAFTLTDDNDPAPGDLAADNAEDNAVVARAARDGKFDDDERPDLRIVGTRMVARGQRLVSIAQRAA